MNSKRDVSPNDNLSFLIFLGAISLFLALITLNIWITDDAYISFRVVDNLLNGYGLRWNIDERVQPFTNPLWTFAHIPFYFLSGDMYNSTIALQLLCSVAAFIIIAKPYYKSPFLFLAVVANPLILSKAVRDFSTSGLENPLTFLLLALFISRFLYYKKEPPWLFISLVAACLILNRLDTILIVIPSMLFLAVTYRKKTPWKPILIGQLPLIVWLLFSLLYYGFLFPNTKYAKLGIGYPLEYSIVQGWHYFLHLVQNDFLTASFIILGIVLGIKFLLQYIAERNEHDARVAMLLIGVLLYSLYIIYIGGDFMSGRYWSSIFIVVVAVFAFIVHSFEKDIQQIFAGALVFLQIVSICITYFAQDPKITNARMISDERRYYEMTSPFGKKSAPLIEHKWSQQGLFLRKQANEHDEKTVMMTGSVGFLGFYAGPNAYIVDGFGLADPLLARLPTNQDNFRIGHFWRKAPQGYLHARKTGDTEFMDPLLRQYYETLLFIIAGPLWEVERIQTILAFNLGVYDHLLDDYLLRHKHLYPAPVQNRF